MSIQQLRLYIALPHKPQPGKVTMNTAVQQDPDTRKENDMVRGIVKIKTCILPVISTAGPCDSAACHLACQVVLLGL